MTNVMEGRRHRGLPWAGLCLIAVTYGLARFGFGLFVPAFRNEFGLSASAVGTISSASYATYCLATAAATVLTPRWGGRTLALLAGALATGGTLLIAVAATPGVLAIGVVVAGASAGVASPSMAHAVAHAVDPARRDRAQTFVNAGTGLGVVVAGPVALLAAAQWRGAWVAFAVASAATTVWVALAVPRGDRGSRCHRFLPRPLLPSGSGRMVLAALTLGASSAAMWTFGRDLWVTEGRMSQEAATVAWILLGACGMLGAAAGHATERWGLRTAWPSVMAVCSGSLALCAFAPGETTAVWVAAAAFGGSYIALTGLLLVWATRLHAAAPAAGVGTVFLLLALGQSAGAPVLGVVWEAVGARQAFVIAVLVGLLGAWARPAGETSSSAGGGEDARPDGGADPQLRVSRLS